MRISLWYQYKVYYTPHFLYLMDSILQESLNDKFWYGWIILEKPNKFMQASLSTSLSTSLSLDSDD